MLLFIALALCEEGENKYQCKRCNHVYENRKALLEHTLVHLTIKPKKLYKCPLCQNISNTQKDAIKHLEDFHSVILETETIVLASFDEFQIWKKNKEQKSGSLYVSYHGSYKTNTFVRFKYFCHRSGVARRQGKGIRRMKTSNKIDAFCPSRMEVIVKADSCEVIFVKTHVGHVCELRRAQKV